jgi:hypothetical protein
MINQNLEQLIQDINLNKEYKTIDLYSTETTVLYTPPPKPFGLLTGQPFQFGYSLGDGYKIDFHGPNKTILTHSHVKDRFGNVIKEFNSYECSMLDYILENNFKKFP